MSSASSAEVFLVFMSSASSAAAEDFRSSFLQLLQLLLKTFVLHLSYFLVFRST